MIAVCIALSLALAACLWKALHNRRRLRALVAQIEASLRTGQPLPVSVRDDAFAQLENAVSELSARLYQSQENARAEARKTEKLIVDLSHQLKTPLAVIEGNADLLAEDEALTPEQREQVEAILRGTEQTRTYLLKIRAQVQTPLKYKRP